ncbi:PAAR domain-containing protein [Intestinirhabdus alba]|uniref:PAAR domain-containing protein n=1 Tax=Intestinirhabdus alba TaxID=2899544 RepID=A0A6L6ISJ7_9ENTR|nr:PAAR domain-containing protein [Intestinirhabdus alba]MTH48944.1 hypothetical protein [Intestinirhabdus alba]
MTTGNYLVRGDKTTCGGIIVEGCEDHRLFGQAIACEGDKVTCGRFPGIFNIVGGIASDSVHGRLMAGTLDSYSSCPCRSLFIPSMVDDTYERETEREEKSNISQDDNLASGEPQELFLLPVERVCRYCRHSIPEGNACKPEFKEVIRGLIDADNNINGVFKGLCEFYLMHYDVWRKEHVARMLNDLHDVVGVNYNSLSGEDKLRFMKLRGKQKETRFYGGKYSDEPTDTNYDKVQHMAAGMWLGANYSYGIGVVTAWTVEKLDTCKAIFGELIGTRRPHHIGFDWYDYAWAVAGAAIGYLLVYVDDERCKKTLSLFATSAESFDSFYVPPDIVNYKGMGTFDPIYGDTAEKIDESLNPIFIKFR